MLFCDFGKQMPASTSNIENSISLDFGNNQIVDLVLIISAHFGKPQSGKSNNEQNITKYKCWNDKYKKQNLDKG